MRFNDPFVRGLAIAHKVGALWDGTTYFGTIPSNSGSYESPVYGLGTRNPVGFTKGQLLRLQRSLIKVETAGTVTRTGDGTFGDDDTGTMDFLSALIFRYTFGETYAVYGATFPSTEFDFEEKLNLPGNPVLASQKERVLGTKQTSEFPILNVIYGPTYVLYAATVSAPSLTAALPAALLTPIGDLSYGQGSIDFSYTPNSGGVDSTDNLAVYFAVTFNCDLNSFVTDGNPSVVTTKFYPQITFEALIQASGNNDPDTGVSDDESLAYISVTLSSYKQPDFEDATSEISIFNQTPFTLYKLPSDPMEANGYGTEELTITVTTEKFWEFRDSDDANPLFDIDTGAPL